MRLTLRTLLAYMDGELERLYPQEAQEIGKKIEGSKFATDLFHEIRDVMRRLRLAAPSVTEKGTNLDCNTVADYLDNALPDERVPDFEEVCLKSDMHLAEAASCHQILAVAQVELFEIEPDSRERMYQLPAIAARVDDERQAAVDAASVLSGDGHGASRAARGRQGSAAAGGARIPSRASSQAASSARGGDHFAPGAFLALILILLGLTNRGTPIGNFLAWAEEKISGRHEERNESGNQPKQPAGEAAKTSGSATPGAGTAASPSGAGNSDKPSGSAPASAAAGSAAPPASSASTPASGQAAGQPGPRPGDMPDLTPPGAGLPAIVAPSPRPRAVADYAEYRAGTPAPATQLPIVPANPPGPDIQPCRPNVRQFSRRRGRMCFRRRPSRWKHQVERQHDPQAATKLPGQPPVRRLPWQFRCRLRVVLPFHLMFPTAWAAAEAHAAPPAAELPDVRPGGLNVRAGRFAGTIGSCVAGAGMPALYSA